MKPIYTQAEARRLMGRWAAMLAACFALTAVLNVSFSRHLLEQREGDPDTHLDRAESRMAALDFKGALVSVENALDRTPLYPRAHKVLGDILFNQDDWDGAESAYRRCLDLGGTYEGVQNNIVWTLIEQESYEEAVALGRAFIQQKSASHLIPRFVAEAYLRAGQWPEAVEYLKIAREANPKDPYLLRRLAMAFGKLGMADEERRFLALLNEVELELEKEQQLSQRPAG